MILLDVNVLIYAFRDDAQEYADTAAFMNSLVNSGAPFGTPEICLTSFIRILTQKAFQPTISLESVFGFCEALRAIPTFMQVRPSDRHWEIFQNLCVCTQSRGKAVADAYLAAFAIDRGDEWVTNDRDFAKFPGLSWRGPFQRHAVTNPR